jgi:hypothetical protein
LATFSFQTQEDVTINFNDATFENLIFKSGGNMIMFEHELTNQITVRNSIFQNITQGSIYIEAKNKQNAESPTGVKIINLSSNLVNSQFRSLIMTRQGSDLEIYDSHFQYNYGYEKGGVISAGYQKTVTKIYNTIFENNTSVEGGVFNIESQSVIECTNCTFLNNFAIKGGAIFLQENGYIELQNSTFTQNYGMSSSVLESFNSIETSQLKNWSLYDNKVITKDAFLTEISSKWNYLWFLQSDYVSYLNDNPNLINVIPSFFWFSLIIGKISILEESNIYQQDRLVYAFNSEVLLQDSIIHNITTEDASIKLVISTLNLMNTTIQDIHTSSNSKISIISGSLESTINMNKLSYANSTLPFLTFHSSVGNITDVNLNNITWSANIISISDCKNLTLKDWEIDNILTSDEDSIHISHSNIDTLENVKITDIQQTVFHISFSIFDKISNLTIDTWLRGMKVESESFLNFENSTFTNLGSSQQREGSAIFSTNSNITIIDTLFYNNTAQIGGSVNLMCSTKLKCKFDFAGNTFNTSNAVKSGGAIYYDLYRPAMNNNQFINNTALYGENIASYPVKIKLKESENDNIILFDVVSGINYGETLNLTIVDHDNQIMVLDDTSKIDIKLAQSGTSLSGTTGVKVNHGVASFDNIAFIATPGSSNVTYTLTAESIAKEKLEKQYETNPKDDVIEANFRFWKPGEIQRNNEWEVCTYGTYSLLWNSTKWELWMENAICLEGNQINVESGYWRISHESSSIVEWFREEACLGGFSSQKSHPVDCKEGYTGLLWAQCEITENDKYEKVTNFECLKWPNPVINTIRVFGLVIVVLIFFAWMIGINIKKKEESQKSILMRIMTNYLQVLSVALSFNIKYPTVFGEVFSPLEYIGAPNEVFLSFDCFVRDTEMNGFAPSVAFFKIFLTAFLPVALFLILILMWSFLYMIHKKWFGNIKRNIIVSIIVIIFMLHPTLTITGLSMFQWIEIDKGNLRVKIDLDMEWYGSEHILWVWI